MLSIIAKTLLFGILTLGLTACRSNTTSPFPDTMIEPISFSTVDSGTQSGLPHGLYGTVVDQARWEGLWRQHANRQLPPPATPVVDWSSEMVVVLALGPCASAGFGIEVEEVREEGDVLYITARKWGPDPDSLQAAVITTPFHFVRVPCSEAKAEFHIR